MITFPSLLEVAQRRAENVRRPNRDATYRLMEGAVQRGVALLDERLGRKFWLARINVAELNVASARDCVACQVTGLRFGDAIDVLGAPITPYPRGVWSDRHGFSLDLAALTDERSYATLTEAWVRKVTELRAEQSAEVTA